MANEFVVKNGLIAQNNITVTGSIISTAGITGSLLGTASTASYVATAQTASYVSNAQSSSYATKAVTSSYADALTVAGTLTAQTLLVQTITSSIDFVTGSTRFGTLSANTHQFTGSVGMSGSLNVGGASSLNTATVSGSLTVSGSGTIATYNSDVLEITGSLVVTGSSTLIGTQVITGSIDVDYKQNATSNFYFRNTNIVDASSRAYLNVVGGNNRISLYSLNADNNYINMASGSFYIQMNAASSVINPFFINSNGNVGIGGSDTGYGLVSVTATNNTTIGSTEWGTSLGGALSAAVYNFSQTVGTGAGIKLITRNSGASIWGIYNISTGASTGDLAFGNGTGGSGTEKMRITNGGNVGIGTTSPAAKLDVTAPVESPALGTVALIARTYNGANDIFRWYDGTTQLGVFKNSGNVGIGTTSPLATLATLGGAVQFMGDYANHQTIIKSAGTAGTLSGTLVITIPDMAGAASSVGYGGYSCEVYVAGFNGMYCHAWFSGYTNTGITASETAILRSNGGWSVSQSGYANQGMQFTIDYPADIIHPTARIIFNKGGHLYNSAYPANSITATWT